MKTFNNLSLSQPLRQGLEDLGFETPSQIQAEALPLLLGEATDFIGLAATGTGKTAAFGIPALERIDPDLKATQVLILCPTRELALQVAGQLDLIGKHLAIRSLPIYGGSGYREQIDGLAAGVPIVVGTPGRLIDHLERGRLKLDRVKTIILDEADEMISMGFKEELERILGATDREQSNTWLFSATMGREVSRVAKTYLREPKRVQVNREEMLSANVEQYFYAAREADKPEILCKIIENADDLYGLIFCQTKSLVTDLTTYLGSRGYKVDCLHGDMDQRAREKAMQGFRDRKANLLVCTDVASRGLDVKDVTHVFNYSLPREIDNYVHRIGRTARGGKTGIAVNLVTPSHRGLQRRIEGFTKSRMIEGKVPTRRDIGTKKISKILGQFKAQESHDRATSLLSEDWNQVIAEMPTHEIIGRFLTLLSPEIFEDREKVGVVLGEGAGAPAREEAPKSPFRRPERPSRFKKKPKGKFSKRERPPRGRPKKKHRKGTSVVGTASR